MDESVCNYAKDLIARARMRGQVLSENNEKVGVVGAPCKVTLAATPPTAAVDNKEQEQQGDHTPNHPSSQRESEVSSGSKENHTHSQMEEEQSEPHPPETIPLEEQPEEVEEKEEEEDVEMEAGEEEQPPHPQPTPQTEQVLPLSSMLRSGVREGGAAPAARRGRLSVLASTINAWEDDLSSIPKHTPSKPHPQKKTPRFSVSTPPSSSRGGVSLGRQSNCHQFVQSSGGRSPLRPAPTDTPDSPNKHSPAKRLITSTPLSSPKNVGRVGGDEELSKIGLLSPSIQFSPVQKSPTRSATTPTHPTSPVKSCHSPLKSLINASSAGKTATTTPTKAASPTKTSNFSAASPSRSGMRRGWQEQSGDATTTILESQGFVRQQVDGLEAGKRRPAGWSKGGGGGPAKLQKLDSPSAGRSTPDPSTLSVAQKARLFESQQQQQQLLRQQELAVLADLKKSKNSEEKKEELERGRHARAEDKPKAEVGVVRESPSPRKTFLFGESIPAPPPMPPQMDSPPKAAANSPQKPKTPEREDGEQVSPSAAIASSVRRIGKVVVKQGAIYPSLTDIEATSEGDSEGEESPSPSPCSSLSTSSLGQFIQNKAAPPPEPPSMQEMNTTLACQQIDDLIDEALEGQSLEEDTLMGAEEPSQGPPKPLLHSISLYRKTQQMQRKKSSAEEEPLGEEDEAEWLGGADPESAAREQEQLSAKIEALEQQLLIQQRAIAQASKALNICESSFEFSNSTENVEGERVLLIATQKRSQYLWYLGELKQRRLSEGLRLSEPALSPGKERLRPSPCCTASIAISQIQLYPIKSARLHQDYVYHFIAIAKHNDTVLSTSTVRTSSNAVSLEFPTELHFEGLRSDFRIQLEVYALRTFKQMDVLPHHMKYHIKQGSGSSGGEKPSGSDKRSTLGFLTPNRTPKATNLRSTGGERKEGGGGAGGSGLAALSIRSSKFTLQGTLTIDLSKLRKESHELSLSCSQLLHPSVSVRLSCSSSNQLRCAGFLTVFSDVGGLGAWHRRWAKLDQHYKLLFWAYPEDQAEGKSPVGGVDLGSVITPRVSPCSRETCARPFSFLLVSRRERRESDCNSLVLSVHPTHTAVRHLFCADNRPERQRWIATINSALTNMRAWAVNADFNN